MLLDMKVSRIVGLISKEYISIGMRHFRRTKSKAMRAYVQNGQYHTIIEVRDS